MTITPVTIDPRQDGSRLTQACEASLLLPLLTLVLVTAKRILQGQALPAGVFETLHEWSKVATFMLTNSHPDQMDGEHGRQYMRQHAIRAMRIAQGREASAWHKAGLAVQEVLEHRYEHELSDEEVCAVQEGMSHAQATYHSFLLHAGATESTVERLRSKTDVRHVSMEIR